MYALYSDRYVIELPPHHSFPIRKYREVRDRLQADGTLSPEATLEATPAAEQDILQVHTPAYWRAVTAGSLPPEAVRRLGLPWSPALVERSRASVQGTLSAARIALHDGLAANLAGGTHHAFPDRGEGYCLLNDIAIAVRCLQRDGWLQRSAIIDCDVHQGNGTAAILGGDPDVFTFSIHGANNFPLHKVAGTLDIALPDGSGDAEYLEALTPAVARILAEFRPGLVFYQAGVDPLAGDRFGRLRLTREGLRSRDRLVLETCREANVPVAITLGGGYHLDLEQTVEAHCDTVRVAAALWKGAWPPGAPGRRECSASPPREARVPPSPQERQDGRGG